MKLRIFAIFLSALLAPWALAEDPAPIAGDDVAPATAPDKGQIEVLLAPVALYPDALVALILPASTHPSEIVLASRFLQSGGNEADIDAQPWDDSVKALARYPEVIQFMDENLAWTQDVGDAFVAYPADVMTAIQTLRARGARNGLLADTPQQKVEFDDDDTIRIVPTEPDVIYVPYYEPSYLYYTDSYVYYPSSFLWFGVGYGIGSWLSYDCNWGHRTIWVTHYTHWDRGYDWRRRYDHHAKWYVGGSNWNCWKPSPGHHFNRSRSDFNYAHARIDYTRWNRDSDHNRAGGWNRDGDHRNNGGWTRDGDHNRDGDRSNDRNNGSGNWTRHPTTSSSGTGRSVSRPDTLHNPSSVDRGGDNTRFDRSDRNDTRSHARYNDTPEIETTTSTSTTQTHGPQPDHRSLAPIHRRPDLVNQRDGSIDRRGNSTPPPRAPAPAPTVRHEQPRQTVSSPPPPRRSPAPTRTITSGADVRHPRSSPPPAPARVYNAPSPSVTRSEPARSSPEATAAATRHPRRDREN